jgi:hypothetical protein
VKQSRSSPIPRVGTLEIHQDLPFEEKYWKVQKIARVGLVFALVLAALGLFGAGPLSEGKVVRGNFEARYERFERLETVYQIDLRIPVDGQGAASIWVSPEFLKKVRIERISPEPLSEVAEDGGARFIFNSKQPEAAIQAVFHYEPLQMGPRKTRLRWGEDETALGQFVYP